MSTDDLAAGQARLGALWAIAFTISRLDLDAARVFAQRARIVAALGPAIAGPDFEGPDLALIEILAEAQDRIRALVVNHWRPS